MLNQVPRLFHPDFLPLDVEFQQKWEEKKVVLSCFFYRKVQSDRHNFF